MADNCDNVHWSKLLSKCRFKFVVILFLISELLNLLKIKMCVEFIVCNILVLIKCKKNMSF